jgi:uncharacterized protein YwgA
MRFTLSQRVAVLANLIQALHRVHSWCGETHIQKAVYFLQNADVVPLGYNYILYKHGPYSFDLTEDLGTMRGAGFTELAVPVAGYGPSIRLTRLAEEVFLHQEQDDEVDAVTPIIEDIVLWLGTKDVRSLERVATAYYVLRENPAAEPQSRAQRLRKLKPHISEGESIAAFRELDEKLSILAH